MALQVFARVYENETLAAIELPIMSTVEDLLNTADLGFKRKWSVVVFQNNKLNDKSALLADLGIGMEASVEIIFDKLSFKMHIITIMEKALLFPILEFTHCYSAAYGYCFTGDDITVGHVLVINESIDELGVLLENDELDKHYAAEHGSLIHDAVAVNNLAIAKLLIQYDFPVNDYNEEYQTPLEYLLKSSNPNWDMFLYLIDAGAISKTHQSELPQFIHTWFDKMVEEEGFSREDIQRIFNF